MSNVLDVKLPRKRMRLAFSLPLTVYFTFFHVVFGVLGIGGFLLSSSVLLSHLLRQEWPSSSDWFMWFVTIGVLLFFLFWARDFVPRILPGRVQIVAVRIIRQQNTAGWRGFMPKGSYGFSGARIARIIQQLPAIAPPATLIFLRCEFQRINFTKFGKKPHKILYLDEKRQIALAAEKCWGGGAVLLDENLTHLRLSRQEKQQFLTSLRIEQAILGKSPERLNTIVKSIPRSRRIVKFRRKTAPLWKILKKYQTANEKST